MNRFILKKYILPLLLGVGLFFCYYKLNSFYNIDKRDLIGAFLFIAIFVVGIIIRQINDLGSVSKLDKVFKYLFYQHTFPKKKTEFDIQKYIDDDSFVVSLAKTKLLGSLFVGLITICYVIYLLVANKLYVSSILSVYVLIKIATYILKELRDNKPKIVIKKEGIATAQLGFIKWDEAKLIQFRDTSTNDTDSTNLDIFLTEKEKWKRPEFTINIDNLDKSKEEIEMSIITFSDYKHLMNPS